MFQAPHSNSERVGCPFAAPGASPQPPPVNPEHTCGLNPAQRCHEPATLTLEASTLRPPCAKGRMPSWSLDLISVCRPVDRSQTVKPKPATQLPTGLSDNGVPRRNLAFVVAEMPGVRTISAAYPLAFRVCRLQKNQLLLRF